MLFCTKSCQDGVVVLEKISSENLSNSKKSAPASSRQPRRRLCNSERARLGGIRKPCRRHDTSTVTQFSPSCPVALVHKMTVYLATHPGQAYLVPNWRLGLQLDNFRV